MRTVFRLDEVPARPDPRQREQRLYRVASAVVVCVVLVIMFGSMIGDGGLVVMHNQRDEAASLRERISQEQARARALSTRVESLRSASFELERVAREELGLIREGEIVFDFRPATIR